MDLGNRDAVGKLNPQNPVTAGGWTITLDSAILPRDMDCEMFHAVANGPGGYFMVYLDTVPYGLAQNGRINEYAPSGRAMPIKKGQTVYLHWSVTTGNAPHAWCWFQTPTP